MNNSLSPGSSRLKDRAQFLISTLFSLYSFPTVYTDIMLDMMARNQNEFFNIPLVPQEQSKLDFPAIYDANGALSYSTSSSGTVAGFALLVTMSPVFRETISLRVNHPTTDVATIQKKSTTVVIKKKEKVSKTI